MGFKYVSNLCNNDVRSVVKSHRKSIVHKGILFVLREFTLKPNGLSISFDVRILVIFFQILGAFSEN